MKASRKLVALCIVAIIVVSAVVAVYFTRITVAPQISLAPSTFVAVQGTGIAFTAYGIESNGIATVFFGDGHEANTTSTVTYTYKTPGRYLVAAQEFVNGQPVASTFNALQTIQVTPQIGVSVAPLISVPVVSFDVSKNPDAPVIRVGDTAYLYGGFLEPPTGNNLTIMEYVWDFGNGATKTLTANSTSLKPGSNPTTATYTQPGLYPVTLTLVTQNSTSMATYRTSVEQTVAVSSSSQPYTVFLYSGSVPNPSVINVAENAAGGPISFDPQVDSDFLGAEIISNIFSTLLFYNGSSTTQFIPVAATQVPSVANGGISPDYTTYTFQIRTGLKFSNGDPLTAYDVWYSMVRDLLFVGGNVTTLGWVQAQYLIPGATAGTPIMTSPNDATDFGAIMSALTYSNSSNTVTFKLVRPTVPQQLFTALAVEGGNIIDASWLSKIGAGITFTPAGFYAYQNQSNVGGLNLKAQWEPVGSGPYVIQSYVLGQSVTLTPNPEFQGIPGVPVVNDTVVIQWVKDPETAYNLFTTGQADLVTYLPTEYLSLILKQVANGKAAMYQSPSLIQHFSTFNLDINVTALKADFGPQYHVRSDYFANLDVREAFAYAFNYTNYLNEIVGDVKYGIDFGNSYAGVIIPGLPDYVPPGQLQNVPTYDLGKAKQLLEQSGQYGISINIPIVMLAGDAESFAAAQMWAAALNSIDPNIVMNPVYVSLPMAAAYMIPGQNPIPVFSGPWYPDYPYPSDDVDGMYKEGGFFAGPFGWSTQYLNSTGHADQAAMFAKMNSLIQIADSTTNSTLAAQEYKQLEQIAINLYMYVYLRTDNQFWVVKPYINGYQGRISYEENPITFPEGLYFWWVKTCGTLQSCSGRNIGP